MELKFRHKDGESFEIDFEEEDLSISDAIRDFRNWYSSHGFTGDIQLTLSEGGIPVGADDLCTLVLAGFSGYHQAYGPDKWVDVINLLWWFTKNPDDLDDYDLIRAVHHLSSQTEVVERVIDSDSWSSYEVFETASEAGKQYENGFNECPSHLESYVDWEQVGIDHSSTYELDGTTYYVLD